MADDDQLSPGPLYVGTWRDLSIRLRAVFPADVRVVVYAAPPTTSEWCSDCGWGDPADDDCPIESEDDDPAGT